MLFHNARVGDRYIMACLRNKISMSDVAGTHLNMKLPIYRSRLYLR